MSDSDKSHALRATECIIPIDRMYYDSSIAVMKKLAGHVSGGGWSAFEPPEETFIPPEVNDR